MTSSDAGRGTRVMVVDDNRDVADGLAAVLRFMGCNVRVIYFSPDAVAAATEFHPDCIISDISMPGMDGYELAHRLRSEQLLQRVPLFAHTATSNERRAKEAGFDRVLVKPVTAAQILELLKEVRTMDERLKRVEKAAERHGEVVSEVKDLLKQVGADVQELKGDLQEDVKELKEGLQEVKEEVEELKKDLRDVQQREADPSDNSDEQV